MEYVTATELSKKWGVSSRMVAYYCETGRIEGSIKKGKLWLIPDSTKKPADKRRSKDKLIIQNNQNLHADFEGINKIDTDNYSAVYRANDLYRNLGLTRETLRYYEEIGLISPERNPSSQYREFSFQDISHLMAIDFYRKRGFTAIEIRDLMKSGKQSGTLNYMNRKIADLQEGIEIQNRMLRHLNATKEFYEYVIIEKGNFSIKQIPLFLVQESFDAVSSLKEYQKNVLKYLNLREEDILSNLVRVVTFNSSGYKGSRMCIVKPATRIEQQTGQVYLDSGKCLYTAFDANSHDDSIMENMFLSCHEWSKNHQVEFKGVVYIFIRFVDLSEQTGRNFYEVWIPLKEK